ncbi:hypothetical protein [Arthrobacter sp. Y81]|uniref:hypothetical protein n=1 Tax=Arthrobacter sp. Y81 TaxID=2058897 RepID=UPI000CE33315|nr:hypothetical protein [Arthrobacter sp. Y81]
MHITSEITCCRPQALKDIFAEFTPWFRSEDVNFGADEYPEAFTEYFRNYYNNIAAHLRTLGKKPSAWGSFTVAVPELDPQ